MQTNIPRMWMIALLAATLAGGAAMALRADPAPAQGAAAARPIDSPLVQKGAALEKVAGDIGFAEGPACDEHGNVYFTDQPRDRILRWDAQSGKITTFLHPCGRSNGLCFDAKGNIVACADEHNELWSIDPAGRHTVLVKDYGGKLLNGPNDVWIRPDGGLYLTDFWSKRDYWTRGPMEQSGQHVYYLTPDRKTLMRVTSNLKGPNGIIGTPDGKTLYISDLLAGGTYSYVINADGSLSGRKLFCKMGSDGMTLDSAGNVYLTNHGVSVFDPAGKKLLHIPIDEKWTGNICFGGADRHTLFITASTSVYTLRMTTHGVGSQ
jgi:gluconolactonase